MKYACGTFTFAARLIPIFFLLLFVAPHAPARQDENTSSEADALAKAPNNQRPPISQRGTSPQGNNKPNTVAVQILASKTSDCAIGSRPRIQLTDLNDMLDHLREQVDAGMKILSEEQGKDGLPAAPAANPRAVPEGIAAPDPTAAADLQKQEQEADETEKEVQQEASAAAGVGN